MPNIKVCSVAGVMNAGADCAWTLSPKTEEMNVDQLINFLEPNEETEKAGAMIMSATDFQKLKTEFEKACKKLGGKCKNDFRRVTKNIKRLGN